MSASTGRALSDAVTIDFDAAPQPRRTRWIAPAAAIVVLGGFAAVSWMSQRAPATPAKMRETDRVPSPAAAVAGVTVPIRKVCFESVFEPTGGSMDELAWNGVRAGASPYGAEAAYLVATRGRESGPEPHVVVEDIRQFEAHRSLYKRVCRPRERKGDDRSPVGVGSGRGVPIAGLAGVGALESVGSTAARYVIGVDIDWALDYPDKASAVLTSVEKRFNLSAISAIKALAEGRHEGRTHIGTIANGEVGISPFHQLESLVSSEIRYDLGQIKTDIITGKLKTRP